LKNSKFSKKCLRHSLRGTPRANKNLHIPSGYALGILLHNICPQAIKKFAYNIPSPFNYTFVCLYALVLHFGAYILTLHLPDT
ncbi:hypothetical protein T4E_3804, partial [Trichinella pseudospiralis]